MGNAVGPVTLIALGIYLGYLTLTGRAANLVAFLTSGGNSLATTTATSAQSGTSTLSSVTNPWGIMNATPQQAAANAQVPLTVDAGPGLGTGGAGGG